LWLLADDRGGAQADIDARKGGQPVNQVACGNGDGHGGQ